LYNIICYVIYIYRYLYIIQFELDDIWLLLQKYRLLITWSVTRVHDTQIKYIANSSHISSINTFIWRFINHVFFVYNLYLLCLINKMRYTCSFLKYYSNTSFFIIVSTIFYIWSHTIEFYMIAVHRLCSQGMWLIKCAPSTMI